MNKQKPLNRLLFIIAVIVYVIALFVYGFYEYTYLENKIMEDIDTKLYNSAVALKYILPDDFHDRAIDEQAISIKEDKYIAHKLTKLIKETGFKYTYTIVKKGDKLFFITSDIVADPETKRRTFYFYPYEEADESFFKAFDQVTPTYKTVSDQWGAVRTVMVPEKSPGGINYLACADYDINYVKGLLQKNLLRSIATVLFFLLLSAPVIIIYTKSLRKYLDALRDSEEKYKELTNSLPQVVFETDATGKLTFVNQNAFDLFGYTEEDFNKGLNALQVIIPEDRDRAMKNIQKILNGDILVGEEYTALRKDGTTFLVEIHSNLFMHDNKPMGLRGLIIDLSKSKKMETDLKRRAMAMDQSTETIVITDTKGLITYVNPAFEKTTGYSHAEALGKNPRILQSGKHDAMFYHELWQTISKGKTWSGRFVNRKKDRSQYTEEATISPVFSDEGEIVNYVAVKRDISDKLKLEAQLQQAQKMEAIGNLAGGIAHDFNNILFPLVGYAEMLKLDLPVDSPLHGHIDEILHAALRSKDLVKQILMFSRQGDQDIKPIKLQPIVKEAIKLLRSSIPTTIDIQQGIDPDCGVVVADPTQIHQIVMNLATNAYHAMEKTGGKLTVNLKEVALAVEDLKDPAMIPGKYVCLTVADNGPGMEKSIIDRIFDPYFTTKKEGRGTGLGLAVVHGIVKSHDGDISVYSEPGNGAEFKVYLPVIKEQKETAKVETDMPIQKGDERILLVDDEDIIVQMEKQMLERLGYHVTARTSSVEALEAFRAKPDKFDVVITDMTMPNMTGDKLAAEIMKIRSDIPVILCTGFSEMMSKEKAAALGIKGFLMKPIVMKELSSVIRKVLDQN